MVDDRSLLANKPTIINIVCLVDHDLKGGLEQTGYSEFQSGVSNPVLCGHSQKFALILDMFLLQQRTEPSYVPILAGPLDKGMQMELELQADIMPPTAKWMNE